MTIDVEDYFHVSGFERHIAREDWPRFDSRVRGGTERILDALDSHGVQATFFVLGWLAERDPQLVRSIRSRGHEIGSHSYWHRLVYQLTPEEFRADVRRSRDVLEGIIGERVRAYRAPSFSITRRSAWALRVLAEEGFQVDSSVYPVVHDRYGFPGAPLAMHVVETGAGTLWEAPPAVWTFGRLKVPVGGGGYFRLLPWNCTAFCLGGINKRAGRPFTFYLHPWELDAEQPRLRAGSRWGRFRHYLNLHKTETRLAALLRRFRFGSLSACLIEAVAQLQGASAVRGAYALE